MEIHFIGYTIKRPYKKFKVLALKNGESMATLWGKMKKRWTLYSEMGENLDLNMVSGIYEGKMELSPIE